MKCPRDDVALITAARGGVEINRCPTCGGVWLDRGELDKIVAAALAEPPALANPAMDEDGYHPTSTKTRPAPADQGGMDSDGYHPTAPRQAQKFLARFFGF